MKTDVLCFALFGIVCLSRESPGAQELTSRQQDIVRGIVKFAPWDCPDRWLYELGTPAERSAALRTAMTGAHGTLTGSCQRRGRSPRNASPQAR